MATRPHQNLSTRLYIQAALTAVFAPVNPAGKGFVIVTFALAAGAAALGAWVRTGPPQARSATIGFEAVAVLVGVVGLMHHSYVPGTIIGIATLITVLNGAAGPAAAAPAVPVADGSYAQPAFGAGFGQPVSGVPAPADAPAFAAQGYTPQSYAPQSYAPQTYAPQTYAPQSYAPQPTAAHAYASQHLQAAQPFAPQPAPGFAAGAAVPAQPTATPTPTAPAPAGRWAPDPSGRHHYRWWDGQTWTAHVSTDGATAVDPI